MNSRTKKSPSSRARRKTPVGPRCRAWRAALPTPLERDTFLTPERIAESLVQEAERFLKAELPENFAERFAAKGYSGVPKNYPDTKQLVTEDCIQAP